eukprot:4143552-Alexandrium_andersonii.AAC.1
MGKSLGVRPCAPLPRKKAGLQSNSRNDAGNYGGMHGVPDNPLHVRAGLSVKFVCACIKPHEREELWQPKAATPARHEDLCRSC